MPARISGSRTPVSVQVDKSLFKAKLPTIPKMSPPPTVTVTDPAVLGPPTRALAEGVPCTVTIVAFAQQFLATRAAYQQTQYNLLETQLGQELAAAQQQVATASTDAQKTIATNNLGAVQGYVTPTLTAARTTMQAMTKGSVVLNAAEPVKVSRLKAILEYAAAGLLQA